MRAAVALACIAMAVPASGATLTWDGGSATTNNWSDAANWNPNQLPVTGDTLQFGGATRLAPQNAVANFEVQGLVFIAGASSFTIGGLEFNLDAGGIQNNSANLQTIAAPINLNGSQTWAANSGALAITGAIDRVTSNLQTLTISGSFNTTFTGTANPNGVFDVNLAKTGTGTLILNSALTSHSDDPFGFANYTLTQGALQLGRSNQIYGDSFSGRMTVNGGTFDVGAFSDTVGSLRLTSGTLTGTTGVLAADSITLESGTVSAILGNGIDDVFGGTVVTDVTKSGSGTVTMTKSSTYSGVTSVQAGTLSLTANNALNASSAVIVAGGATLSFGGTTQAAGSLADPSGLGGGNVNLGSATLTLGGNNSSTTFSGVISGSGGLIKVGTGTQTLTGVNTYGGGTTINAGVLSINSDAALGAAGTALNINAATLLTTQTITTTRTITLGAGTDNISVAGFTELTVPLIGGAGLLAKSGGGTLVLTGTNTYAGGTTINGGTVRVTRDANLGAAASALTLTNGLLEAAASFDLGSSRPVSVNFGGFSVAAGATLTVANPISGLTNSVLRKTGPGVLVLSGANTYSSTQIEEGTVLLGASERLLNTSTIALGTTFSSPTTGVLNLGTNSETVDTVTLNAGSIVGTGSLRANVFDLRDGTVSAPLAGGQLSKNGSFTPTNTVVLTAANTYTGSTLVNGGTLRVGSASNVIPDGSPLVVANAFPGFSDATFDVGNFTEVVGPVSLQSGTIIGSGMLIGQFYAVQEGTVSARLGGFGALVKDGAGTVSLTGINTYSGGTTVNDGVLSIVRDENLGDAITGVALNGGTLEAAGASFASSRAFVLSNAPAISVQGGTALTLNGSLTGSGSLTKLGDGTLTLAGTVSYGGATTVQAGTLAFIGANRLPSTTALTIGDGATVDLGGFSQTAGLLAGSGTVQLGTLGTLTVGTLNADSTYAGVIAGRGGLTKAGTGTLTLAGTNTYTGNTQVSNGTLAFGTSDAIAASTFVNVSTLGRLALNDFDQTIRQLGGSGQVLLGSATLSIGSNVSSSFGGVISGTGSLVKIGSALLTLSGANTYGGGTTVLGGTLNVSQDANLGAANAPLAIDGGVFQSTSSFSTARPLSLGASGGTFNLPSATTLTLSGAVQGPGSLTKAGTGTLVLSGNYSYGGPTTINGGVLNATGGYLAAGAAITIAQAGELQTSGVVNRQVLGAGTLTATGTLILGELTAPAGVSFGGTLNVGTNLVQLAGQGQATLSGTVNLGAGGRLTTLNQAAGTLLASGATLNASGGAFVDGVFVNRGVVHGPSAAGSFLTYSDEVSGAGSYTGNILFSDDFRPGESPAAVSFENFAVDRSANVHIELAGLAQGSQYDFINVSGLAELDGTLSIHLLDGFMPTAGNSFDVMHWGSRSGEFASLTGLDLGGGLFLQPVYGASGLTLIAAAAVPEAETYAMLLAGLALLGFSARRRKVLAR